jgi:hypothetical protein
MIFRNHLVQGRPRFRPEMGELDIFESGVRSDPAAIHFGEPRRLQYERAVRCFRVGQSR